jgi:hypothetical protein
MEMFLVANVFLEPKALGSKRSSDFDSRYNSHNPPGSSLFIASRAVSESSGWQRANLRPFDEKFVFK